MIAGFFRRSAPSRNRSPGRIASRDVARAACVRRLGSKLPIVLPRNAMSAGARKRRVEVERVGDVADERLDA